MNPFTWISCLRQHVKYCSICVSIWPGKQTVGKHLSVWESDGARLVPKFRNDNQIIYRIHANVTSLLALTIYIITSFWIDLKVHLILQLEKLYKVSIIIQVFPRVANWAYSNVTELSNALSNWLWNCLKEKTYDMYTLLRICPWDHLCH